MIELLQCPHGGGPLHLLVDLWWLLLLFIPGSRRLFLWCRFRIWTLCCGHLERREAGKGALSTVSDKEHCDRHCHCNEPYPKLFP